MTNNSQENQSIIGIQYLRGIAALMVVFFHARSYFGVVPDWTRIGSRGVDIFFVISGFIMVYATRKISFNESLYKTCANFLGKRFIRVVPLYWLALLVTVYPYFINWYQTQTVSADLITIFQDFAFIPHLSIDEDEKGEIFPALIQGWTLNYEVFFYLLFGLSILARQYRIALVAIVFSLLVLIGKLNHFHNIGVLFYTNSILLEFVYGILLYEIFIKTRHIQFSRLIIYAIGIAGILLLASGSTTNNKVVMGAASAFIVWFFIQVFQNIHLRPLKLLGDASYSIYLFHLLSFKFAREVISLTPLEPKGYVNIITIIGIHILISIISGIAIYFLIEKPLLRYLRTGFDKLSQFGATRLFYSRNTA